MRGAISPPIVSLLRQHIADADDKEVIGLLATRGRVTVVPEIVLQIQGKLLVDRHPKALVGAQSPGVWRVEIVKALLAMEKDQVFGDQGRGQGDSPYARRSTVMRAGAPILVHIGKPEHAGELGPFRVDKLVARSGSEGASQI